MFHSFYGPNSKSETYTTHARAHTHMHVCMFAHAHYPVASLPFSPPAQNRLLVFSCVAGIFLPK
jgi:hypothetical protein